MRRRHGTEFKARNICALGALGAAVAASAIVWSLRKSNRRQIIGLMPRKTTLNW
jgi:hypothetical protein